MIISVGVVAYNEQNTLPKLFECIKAQTYPHGKMEIVLVDSMSKDDTKSLMEKFKKENKDFCNIQVLDNPQKKLAGGWNVILKNYHGDAVVRIDAHAEIPEGFCGKECESFRVGRVCFRRTQTEYY